MEHLKYLSYANYALGALELLAAILVFILGLASAGLAFSAGAEPADVVMASLPTLVASVVVFVIALLFFATGRGVAKGRSRGLQTLLAVLSMCNCPGIFYAGYAMWVCYANESTKQVFEEGGLLD